MSSSKRKRPGDTDLLQTQSIMQHGESQKRMHDSRIRKGSLKLFDDQSEGSQKQTTNLQRKSADLSEDVVESEIEINLLRLRKFQRLLDVVLVGLKSKHLPTDMELVSNSFERIAGFGFKITDVDLVLHIWPSSYLFSWRRAADGTDFLLQLSIPTKQQDSEPSESSVRIEDRMNNFRYF